MVEKVYKKIEVVGVSDVSVSQAIKNAVAKASQTVRNLDWFEATEIRGVVRDGKPVFQVTVKIGFRLEDPDAI